jgi:hypothetical protein
MNCTEFEREWQELDDPALFSPPMEEHMRSCAGCAGLVREVNLLRWEARQLAEHEQPPTRLWANIRSELGREGLLREPGARSWLSGVLDFGWLPRLPVGVAYASVFFLALVGADYLRDRVNPLQAPEMSATPAAPEIALQRADVASEPAQEAREEERVIQRVIEKAPPEKREIYLTRWNQLNSSSNVLRSFVAAHPDDQQAILQLSEIQDQQRRFLESVMRWELEEF